MRGKIIFDEYRFLYIGKIRATMEKQLDCKLLWGRTVFVLFADSIPGVAQMFSNFLKNKIIKKWRDEE